MKKLIIPISVIALFLSLAFTASAQMMKNGTGMSSDEISEHTKKEEAEGQAVWNKLQAKQIACDKLSEDDFAVLGEYFMGQMMGEAHSAMNEMMIRTHGEDGEEQIHIVMGQRLSGCNTQAAFSANSFGWMPMMQMMWGGWSGGNAGMMGYSSGTGWITTLLVWALLILGIAFLWKSIAKK